ncbi:hypothetical protein AFLA_004703 [Aspergillus flavus NRRL3357]|nr:hypothetical protein AFLA_004703 [Aspergillus flavus NRRL3357]
MRTAEDSMRIAKASMLCQMMKRSRNGWTYSIISTSLGYWYGHRNLGCRFCRSSEVIGNDLSPIQPRWVPPNYQFEIDDFESE